MFKKLVLAFAVLALTAAFAGTIPAVHTYRITLARVAVVNGTTLQPGDYRLTVNTSKITLVPVEGKKSVEAPAKVETVERKFDDTAIRYTGQNLSEIRLGGTKLVIELNPVATQ
jgi:hypothetical protein